MIKNKIFMIKKLFWDIFNLYQYPITKDIVSSDLGEYYFVFDEKRIKKGKDQRSIVGFDKNGIPITKKYIDARN